MNIRNKRTALDDIPKASPRCSKLLRDKGQAAPLPEPGHAWGDPLRHPRSAAKGHPMIAGIEPTTVSKVKLARQCVIHLLSSTSSFYFIKLISGGSFWSTTKADAFVFPTEAIARRTLSKLVALAPDNARFLIVEPA